MVSDAEKDDARCKASLGRDKEEGLDREEPEVCAKR